MKTYEKYLNENNNTILAALLQKIEGNIKELKTNKKRFPEFADAFDQLIANFNKTKNDLMKDIKKSQKKGRNIDITI